MLEEDYVVVDGVEFVVRYDPREEVGWLRSNPETVFKGTREQVCEQASSALAQGALTASLVDRIWAERIELRRRFAFLGNPHLVLLVSPLKMVKEVVRSRAFTPEFPSSPNINGSPARLFDLEILVSNNLPTEPGYRLLIDPLR